MQVTISQSTLARELALAAGAVERKTTIPILSCVLLEATPASLPGERSTLTITATDLEVSLRLTIEADVKQQGKAAIPVKRLLDYVRLLDGGDVTIKATTGWVNVTCGKSKTRMATMDTASYPEIPAPIDAVCELPARPFAAAINRVLFAVCRQKTRFTLDGALMEFAPGITRLVATDGHRLCVAEFAGGNEDAKRGLVGARALRELSKLAELSQLGEAFYYGRNDDGASSMQFFALGDRLLSARALTGNFPEYQRVLPKGNKHTAIVSNRAFGKALSRAGLFTDQRTSAIRLKIASTGIEVSAALADLGESGEQVDATVNGPEMETGFNAGYLLEFLSAAGTDKVQISYNDSNSALLLRPVVDGDEASHAGRYDGVIMPMRV